jgi:broad specificity phosphatase PhoE
MKKDSGLSGCVMLFIFNLYKICEVDMTRLYIIRHGETIWNTQKRMQGHLDSELTDTGKRQAQLLSRALEDIEFEAVYSSSSGRTLQTAQILVGKRSLPIIPMDSLREIDLGKWEGQIFTEVEKNYPEQFKNFWELPHLYIPAGGEEFSDIIKRAGDTLQALISRHDGKNIMLVTHTVTLKAIRMIVENKELKDLWSGAYIQPTSLSVAEYDNGQWNAIKWGDISHYGL